MSKYGNKRTNGFQSKREAKRAAALELLQKAGMISGLRTQVPFELAPSVVIQGRKRPPLRYFADFVYEELERVADDLGLANYKRHLIVEDAKGHVTDSYRIKRHLMKSVHGIDIREV